VLGFLRCLRLALEAGDVNTETQARIFISDVSDVPVRMLVTTYSLIRMFVNVSQYLNSGPTREFFITEPFLNCNLELPVSLK